MNILVANDDGIRARGLTELVRALSGEASVYVCARMDSEAPAGTGSLFRNI